MARSATGGLVNILWRDNVKCNTVFSCGSLLMKINSGAGSTLIVVPLPPRYLISKQNKGMTLRRSSRVTIDQARHSFTKDKHEFVVAFHEVRSDVHINRQAEDCLTVYRIERGFQ